MRHLGIHAILFDVFGTVVDWRGSLISDLSAWGASRDITADWAGLADAWRGAYAPSMDEVRRGAKPWTVLDDLHRASLQRLLPRFGLSSMSDADLDHIARVWHRLAPWPDSVAGLARLKRTRTIAALSNGNVALLVAMAKHAGLPWDMVFAADLFRHYKPDQETYLGACGLLRLEPAQVLMAAAHAGDLAAAQRLGLRTAFIARPLEHGPGGKSEPTGAWDFSVASIAELAERLDAAPD
jgi:2-haloacid dehalogenase